MFCAFVLEFFSKIKTEQKTVNIIEAIKNDFMINRIEEKKNRQMTSGKAE